MTIQEDFKDPMDNFNRGIATDWIYSNLLVLQRVIANLDQVAAFPIPYDQIARELGVG